MSFNINKTPSPDWNNKIGPQTPNVADVASVVINIRNKAVKLKKSKIKDIAKGLAEIAYSFGETNDPDKFAEDIADDIFDALKKGKKKDDKKKDKKE